MNHFTQEMRESIKAAHAELANMMCILQDEDSQTIASTTVSSNTSDIYNTTNQAGEVANATIESATQLKIQKFSKFIQEERNKPASGNINTTYACRKTPVNATFSCHDASNIMFSQSKTGIYM